VNHPPAAKTVQQTGLCSVVIPTSNRKNRLLRTIRSIQAQTYQSLEILVSNDGSTDGTSEAVHALSDPRIVLVSSDHRTGVSEARNRGIAAASGEFIAVCDDDDFWVAGKLASQIEQLTNDQSDWAYCFEVVVDDVLHPLYEGRSRIGPDFMKRMSSGNPIPGGCSGVVARRRLFDETGWFDPEFSMFADWELWVRFAAVSQPSVWPFVGVLYVVHPSQMSRDMRSVDGELQRFLTKIEPHRLVHGHLEVEPIYLWMATKQWQSGRRLDAARMLLVDKTLRQRKEGARVLAARLAGDFGIHRRRSFQPDAAAAVLEVRALLHHESGVPIEQTPWPIPNGPEFSRTVAGWNDEPSQGDGGQ
jgi:glycosyltransferase involved in cell wall biosynthesis